MIAAVLWYLWELAKGFGGDEIAIFIEPLCTAIFGKQLGHPVAVIVSTTAILVLSGLLALAALREFWRACRGLPIIGAALWRRVSRTQHAVFIAVADLNGDRLGGYKRALLRELQNALREEQRAPNQLPLFSIDILSFPLKFAMRDLSQFGQPNKAAVRLEKRLRFWMAVLDADVIVWGEHQDSDVPEGGDIFLSYVPRSAATLAPAPLSFNRFRISDSSSKEFQANVLRALLAALLGQLSAAIGKRHRQDIESLLVPLAKKIESISRRPPVTLPREQALRFFELYGYVALVLGDSDPAWLEVAVRVYRELLRLDTRKRSPDENASTKSNFGHAIVNLAAHKQSPALFSEGISILEALLNDPLLKGASLGRGIILHTLGNAYSRYGVLEKSEQYIERGLGYIRESVLIFAKTRKDQPAMWVSAQMNIGVGLIALANLTGRNQPLRQAQLPLRKALQGSAGLRHSVLHFEVSRLLGDACRIWGRREDSSRLLIQAATAYRRALAPIYRELQPLDWQATQHELGKVLMRLSEFDEAAFKNNQKLWSGALEAFRMELQIPGENAARRAVTIGYMGNLFVRVGMANRDVQPLNEAVSSFSMALLLLAEAGEAQSSYAKIIGASMEQAKTLIAEIEQ